MQGNSGLGHRGEDDPDWGEGTGVGATIARGLLVLWLLVALTQQYPRVLQRGFADLSRGLRTRPVPLGVNHRISPLLQLLDRLESLDEDRRWRSLLILPMPARFEGDLGRFDEFSPVGLELLADEIFQLAYLSFPRKVDVAFLNSRGNLLMVSYRWEERFVPRVSVDLSQYEMVALPKNAQGIKLDRMELVGQTPDGWIVIYRRTNL